MKKMRVQRLQSILEEVPGARMYVLLHRPSAKHLRLKRKEAIALAALDDTISYQLLAIVD